MIIFQLNRAPGRVRLAVRVSARRLRRRGLRRPRPGGRPDAQGAADRHPGQLADHGLRFQGWWNCNVTHNWSQDQQSWCRLNLSDWQNITWWLWWLETWFYCLQFSGATSLPLQWHFCPWTTCICPSIIGLTTENTEESQQNVMSHQLGHSAQKLDQL